MGIQVLGPVLVDGVDGMQRRDCVVLEALVVHAGAVVDKEVLADALWGDSPPATWPKVIQGCVGRLRKALGPDAIVTTSYGYRLVAHDDELDVRRFERLLTRAREQLASGDPDRAAYLAVEAVSLWRGRALPDLDDWEAGRAESARLEALRQEAQELWLECRIAGGHAREVLQDAHTQVVEAPFRERRWALFARALYLSGRQADALDAVGRARRLLRDELGLDLGAELIELEQAILRQDPALASAEAVVASAVCPYRGLLAYEPEDADTFFGREADVSACLKRLRDSDVLAVVGPSGTGKSSLVRAGVVAALEREGRAVLLTSPGYRPLDSLGALPTRSPWPVLVVDQTEEAFTLCEDPTERASYLDTIADYPGQLVLALRADRVGDLSAHAGCARLVERGLYLLPVMGEADLRQAVEGPARQAGLRLEAGLVDLLVREVDGEPGALPLLSHVLRQTWKHREGPTLTVAGYRRTGGIRSAVAQSAETLYATLEGAQQDQLRALFLRLVSPSGDGEPVRARVARSKVAPDAAHERLVEALVAARLVSSDEGDLQIAHEALARAWPRLRDWLEADVEGQRIFRHLSGAAEAWDVMGRPESELYRGARLAGALQWADRHAAELAVVEREFLSAAERQADAESLDAAERLRVQGRNNRRLRGALAGAALLLLAALVAGLLALRSAGDAERATTVATSRFLASQALVVQKPDIALLLALEALHLDPSDASRAGLLGTLQRVPSLIRSGVVPDGVGTFAVSPDGSRIATASRAGGVSLYDATTLSVLRQRPELEASTVHFDRAGSRLLVAVSPNPPEGNPSPVPNVVEVLDARTLDPTSGLGTVPDGLFLDSSTAVSADGRRFAVHLMRGEYVEGQLLVYDLAAPQRPVLRADLPGFSLPIALNSDGSAVFVADPEGGTVTRYSAASGRRERTVPFEFPTSPLNQAIAISPDDSALAVAGRAGVRLLDPRDLRPKRFLPDTQGGTSRLAFSGDGALLATGSQRGAAVVWDVTRETIVDTVSGHGQALTHVAFSPDRQTLYTASSEERLLAWDLGGARQHVTARSFGVGPAAPWTAWVSPRGRRVAYVAADHATLSFRDLATGAMTPPVRTGLSGGDSVVFSWEGQERRFAALSIYDGVVEVRDGETGRRTASTIVEHAVAVAFSPDGSRVLVATSYGSLEARAATDLEPVADEILAGGPIKAMFMIPGGTRVVLYRGEGDFSVVDWNSGQTVHDGNVGSIISGAAVSPDGARFAVSGPRGEIGLVDLRTFERLLEPVPGAAGREGSVSVAFSPDSAVFATVANGEVELWSARSGRRQGGAGVGGGTEQASVRFASAGELVVATADGRTFLWDIAEENTVATACALAGRNLTRTEWATWLGDRPYRQTCTERQLLPRRAPEG